ncbi:MAG: hypothetical protein CVU57_20100 [Deltaproteobacteria bacterium HGW-Deltaproteobacteria-15]|jgi:hypothetical protein|nr:MAG: hypothetical protein CVU57_20100 [Deltaproteobacteria bacterium HGW-Deltaproteobacteria-15]
MKLALTIDVEEEGLFRGRYEPGDSPVSNVRHLRRLHSVFSDLGIRPTLLVSYQVARHPDLRDLLLELREEWHGEIGAHLHYWNTPPIQPLPHADPVPSEWIPRPLLEAKLHTLLQSLRLMDVNPLSFRMGRFNTGANVISLLEEKGFLADSSVAPFRSYDRRLGGISSLTDPYFPDRVHPSMKGASRILEAPITIEPVTGILIHLLRRLQGIRHPMAAKLSLLAQRLFLLPAQPAWTGLKRLIAAARLHRIRGGRALTLFFHSSELMPGGSPVHRTEEEVRRFLTKLERFLSWLKSEEKAESVTLTELRGVYSRNP